MDIYKWKLNSLSSCKWIICKGITEHSCWSVGMQLTCHIKFCMCDDSMPKYILVCEGTGACNCMPFIDRAVFCSFECQHYIKHFWLCPYSLDPMVLTSNFHCFDLVFFVQETFFIVTCACLGASKSLTHLWKFTKFSPHQAQS